MRRRRLAYGLAWVRRDRAKIEPQLKQANLGPVEVRDIDGKPVQ